MAISNSERAGCCCICGMREEKRGRLFLDSASAAVFSNPGTCSAEKWNQK